MSRNETEFVAREELRNEINELMALMAAKRAERDEIDCARTAAVVWACAKAWLPGYAAHVGRSIECLEILASVTKDQRVADALADLIEALSEMRPSNEDASDRVIQVPAHH